MTTREKKTNLEDLDPISRMLAEAGDIKDIDKSLSIAHIAVGVRVAFKIRGVEESFVKLSGEFMGIIKGVAVFSNLEGVFNVKHKFQPRIPIVLLYGNQAYLMMVIGLKAQRLILAPTPLKAVTIDDQRKAPRYACNVSAILKVEHRGIHREKTVLIEKLSMAGCCISIHQSQDEGATGLSSGKRINLLVELKLRKKRIELPAIVRNLRKDPGDSQKKLAGLEFTDLSSEAQETIGGLTATLKQLEAQQK